MIILHISDTHGKHQILKDLPRADVIVHTGDITEDGTEEEHYLCNEAITIDGIKFYGVPMFLHDDLEGNFPELYGRIPDDTDVLLTHQAPLGILDEQDGINFGDYYLYKRVIEVKPKYHLFGHLHHTEKTRMTFRGVRFSNAAGGKYGRFETMII